MEYDKVVQERVSVRSYKKEPIPPEMTERLMEAARLAPSGSNLQPIRYITVTSEEMLSRLRPFIPQSFVTQAPLLLACVADTCLFDGLSEQARQTPYNQTRLAWNREQLRSYLSLNAGLSLEHVVLKAADLGLGSCIIRMFDMEKVTEALGLDSRYELIALLPVGFPNQDDSAKQPPVHDRRPLADMVLKQL